jgi:hypothetical protein
MKLNKLVLKDTGILLLCVWVIAKAWDFIGLGKYWSVQDFILVAGVILLIAGGIHGEEEKEENTYRVMK